MCWQLAADRLAAAAGLMLASALAIWTLTFGPLAVETSVPCEIAGMGRSTIYVAIAEGRLTARKLGRRTLILRDGRRDFRHAIARRPTFSRCDLLSVARVC